MVYMNNPGHMTKMAAMSIYGKNPLKSSYPEPVDQFQQTWHVELWTIEHYNVYNNYDPVMTLTYFTASSK